MTQDYKTVSAAADAELTEKRSRFIGYTDKEYIFNDSVAGEVVYHDKALAETRFEEIGNQAVVVK